MQERTGSFAAAGLVAAAGAVAVAVGSPLTTRLVDRLGTSRVLLGCLAVNVPSALALVALGLGGAPVIALAAVCALGGLAVPPVSSALRGLWPVLLRGPAELRAALALDALLLETIFVLGPLLAAAALALASPAALLVASTAATAIGTLAFASQPPARAAAGTGTTGDLLGPLAAPGLRVLLVGAVATGCCFGAVEVALPAFADAEGDASLAALAFAAQALGSAAGGLVYGARSAGHDVRRLYLVLLVAFPPSFALLALADSVPALVLVAAVSGCVVAPLTAAETELAGDIAPAGTVTEAYGWMLTGLVAGIAAGNAGAGLLVEHEGWRAAVLAGCVVALLGAAVVLARARTLRAPAPA